MGWRCQLVHENNHLMWLVWRPGVSSPCPLQPHSDQWWGGRGEGVRQLLTACHSLGLGGLLVWRDVALAVAQILTLFTHSSLARCCPHREKHWNLPTWGITRLLSSHHQLFLVYFWQWNSTSLQLVIVCNSPPITSLKVDFSDLGPNVCKK